MKVGKPTSKRVTVRLRHKIQKASANKQRKNRKEAKKNPQWRSRLKKDPGIPNLFPYKDKILAEIEESKRKKEEEKERRKELARAQREGRAVEASGAAMRDEDEDDEENEDLVNPEADSEGDIEDEEMDEREDSNPMAALLASAQARARAYTKEDDVADKEDEQEQGQEEAEFGGFPDKKKKISLKPSEPTRKSLPKSALENPQKPVSKLIVRLQATEDGIPQLLSYYQLPPLVTAGSDVTTRFLVDVARKRGRLGRGGVPNLHAAAVAVLGDLNEGRLQLPALQQRKPSAVTSKGQVQIVSQLAEPFRIEGLFSDEPTLPAESMELEG